MTRTLPGAYSRENEAVGWEVPSLTRTRRLSPHACSTFFPVTETSLRVPLCDSVWVSVWPRNFRNNESSFQESVSFPSLGHAA